MGVYTLHLADAVAFIREVLQVQICKDLKAGHIFGRGATENFPKIKVFVQWSEGPNLEMKSFPEEVHLSKNLVFSLPLLCHHEWRQLKEASTIYRLLLKKQMYVSWSLNWSSGGMAKMLWLIVMALMAKSPNVKQTVLEDNVRHIGSSHHHPKSSGITNLLRNLDQNFEILHVNIPNFLISDKSIDVFTECEINKKTARGAWGTSR